MGWQGVDPRQVRKRLVVTLCNAPKRVGRGREAYGALSRGGRAALAHLAGG